MPQRVLWASTGPETVNTIPPETLAAYRNRGHPASRLEQDLDNAGQTLVQLKKIGIDLTELSAQLEKEGIEKFNNCRCFSAGTKL